MCLIYVQYCVPVLTEQPKKMYIRVARTPPKRRPQRGYTVYSFFWKATIAGHKSGRKVLSGKEGENHGATTATTTQHYFYFSLFAVVWCFDVVANCLVLFGLVWFFCDL